MRRRVRSGIEGLGDAETASASGRWTSRRGLRRCAGVLLLLAASNVALGCAAGVIGGGGKRVEFADGRLIGRAQETLKLLGEDPLAYRALVIETSPEVEYEVTASAPPGTASVLFVPVRPRGRHSLWVTDLKYPRVEWWPRDRWETEWQRKVLDAACDAGRRHLGFTSCDWSSHHVRVLEGRSCVVLELFLRREALPPGSIRLASDTFVAISKSTLDYDPDCRLLREVRLWP
jgi:hypothetical protein